MLHENKTSLDIKYQHFKRALPTLTMWLGLEPSYLIPELNSILHTTLCKMSPQFKNIVKETYVKVFELPINDKIPELRSEHLNKLIKVRGVVTARSEIFSQLKKAIYKCIKCGEKKGPYFLHDRESVVHGACRSCQSPGPFIIERMSSVYRNFQRLTIQESPSEVMPGRIPRTKEVILTGDNVDITKPGEDIEVTGIYILRYQLSINLSQGFPVFFAYIEANAVKKYNDISVFSVHEENEFAQFAKRPDVDEIICNSIAPSIFGHDEVK
jgi:DNA replication licensing factor MCM2